MLLYLTLGCEAWIWIEKSGFAAEGRMNEARNGPTSNGSNREGGWEAVVRNRENRVYFTMGWGVGAEGGHMCPTLCVCLSG